MVRPERSSGGHRRWTRRQLALAAGVRALFDEGLTLTAAWKVVSLVDRVDEVSRERDLARPSSSAPAVNWPGCAATRPRQ